MKYPKPKLFKPSKEEVKAAMNKVAEFIGRDKEIGSSNYPDLKVRGKATKPYLLQEEILNTSLDDSEGVTYKSKGPDTEK